MSFPQQQFRGVCIYLTMLLAPRQGDASPGLEIYDVDTEGGEAIMFVTPAHQTVLIDTGNQGSRDAARIAETARIASVTQIDYLLITHYHGDHVGGFLELQKLLPVQHFVDHGPTVEGDRNTPSKQAYDAAAARSAHIIVRAGDNLAVTGVDWRIVSSAGQTLKTVLSGPGAGKSNPYCVNFSPKEITTDLENAQSVGSVVSYGKFRVIALGDLLWNLEAQLACPVNRIGEVALLLTTHHGLNWSGAPALIDILHPVVAVMNNGFQKGGSAEALQTLQEAPDLQDIWQLHWSYHGGLEYNSPGRYIANLEDPATVASALTRAAGVASSAALAGNSEHSPAYLIKIVAQADGSFTVSNSRNGFTKHYHTRTP